jgi:hypothetical protein
MNTAPIPDRFLARVNVVTDGCWLWTGGHTGSGRPTFHANGKTVVAARVSYELFKGPIPVGLLVCHTCDVAGCVNPEHLFVGTQGDNVRDMWTKGRADHRTGEQHPRARLMESDVASIRSRHVRGRHGNRHVLAAEYHVAPTTIDNIVAGRKWRHTLKGV